MSLSLFYAVVYIHFYTKGFTVKCDFFCFSKNKPETNQVFFYFRNYITFKRSVIIVLYKFIH